MERHELAVAKYGIKRHRRDRRRLSRWFLAGLGITVRPTRILRSMSAGQGSNNMSSPTGKLVPTAPARLTDGGLGQAAFGLTFAILVAPYSILVLCFGVAGVSGNSLVTGAILTVATVAVALLCFRRDLVVLSADYLFHCAAAFHPGIVRIQRLEQQCQGSWFARSFALRLSGVPLDIPRGHCVRTFLIRPGDRLDRVAGHRCDGGDALAAVGRSARQALRVRI